MGAGSGKRIAVPDDATKSLHFSAQIVASCLFWILIQASQETGYPPDSGAKSSLPGFFITGERTSSVFPGQKEVYDGIHF